MFLQFFVSIFIVYCTCTFNAFQYTGVNEAGLEFNGAKTYCAPQTSSIQNFHNQGHNIFRIPFAWEEIQSCIRCPLNIDYLNALDTIVNSIISMGGIALIDCHNYFRYYDTLIDVNDLDSFANLWYQLSNHYTNNNQIWFGLMNEPHDMLTENVLKFHQQAIWAIRGTGNNNKIIISGNGWDSLTLWTLPSPYYGTSNTILNTLDDPMKNFIFEMHLYFDSDFSGTHAECTSIDFNLIQQTTTWLRNVNKKAIVTEFGLGNNDNCVDNYGEPFLNFLQQNQDVWIGYTYWSAGPCWPDDYIFTIDPHNNIPSSDKRVQLLQKYSAAKGLNQTEPTAAVAP